MPLCRCLPHGTPVLLRFFLSGLSPPPPDAPPGSLCPPHGVVRLPHGTPVLLRFFLSGLSPPPPDAPPGSLCPPHGVVRLPHGTPVLLRFSFSGLSPPSPRAPPAPAVRPVAVAARKKGMPLESGIPVRAGPVSRVLFPGRTPGPCHLSRAAVSCRLKQPTPRHRASNP